MIEKLNSTHPCKCLTMGQLAPLLGCSVKTLRRLHNAGRLPDPFRIPGSNVWRWRESDIVRYLDEISGSVS